MMAVLSILLLLTLTDAATCLCWIEHHYEENTSLNWTDAQAYCIKLGYKGLSVLDSESEFLNLRHQTDKDGWIGLTLKENETAFTQWSNGQKLNFTMWKHPEPDNLSKEQCVYLNNNEWKTLECKDKKDFFCYTCIPRMIVVQEKKNWEEALVHCRTHYTDLVSLTSKAEDFLVNNWSTEIQTPAFWTSLRFMDGSWFWVNKKSLANVTSLPSCPARPFRCGARNRETGVWENKDCEEKMNFICYQDI